MEVSARLISLADGITGRAASGDGESVLWLHGYTMDSSLWGDLWAALPGWRHIGMDLPGHGGSAPPPRGERLETLAQRVGDIARRYGARQLVALSFGTMLALETAIRLPDAFEGLIVAAPAIAGGPQDPAAGRRYEELMLLHQQRGIGPHLARLWMQSPPDIFSGAALRPSLWQALGQVIGRHCWSELSEPWMFSLTRSVQREPELASIRAATLVMLGEHEIPAFVQCADILERTVPNCRRVTLPATGHLCLLEDPHHAAALVSEHLRRCSRAAVRNSSS